jgi:Transketolase
MKIYFGLDNFGASAPGNEVFKKFGLTTETVSSKIIRQIKSK